MDIDKLISLRPSYFETALLVSEGRSSKEIARIRDIGVRTAEQDRAAIRQILDVSTAELNQSRDIVRYAASIRLHRSRRYEEEIDLTEINRLPFLQKQLVVRGFNELHVQHAGEFYTENKALLEREAEERARLTGNNQSNDYCAVLADPIDWSEHEFLARYVVIEYSMILARRYAGETLPMLSANGLLFCEETRQIILFMRSKINVAHPKTRHTPGGAFIPPGYGSHNDKEGLIDTAAREIHEEIHYLPADYDDIPVVVIEEHAIEFIQAAYLGMRISKRDLDRLKGGDEGEPELVSYDEIPRRLKDLEYWTPSGWLHVMIWLGLQCPGSRIEQHFDGHAPLDLYRQVIDLALDWN